MNKNIGNPKDSKIVLANKMLSMKNETESLMVGYELKAVIVHLGNNAANGHFVCYIFYNETSVLKIDDKRKELVDNQ